MKARERKMKRMQEKSKHSTELDENDMPKKKLTSIPSKRSDMKLEEENSNEINEDNKIQDIAASRPANNVDVEKISQRLKDRKERRKRKKMIEAGINPTFVNSKDNDNNNSNQKEAKNNKNYISDKDLNKLAQSVESGGAPPQKGEFPWFFQ